MVQPASLRLSAAVCASVMAHAGLMSGGWLRAPEMTAATVPLEARLVRAEPVPAPAAIPEPPRELRRSPSNTRSRKPVHRVERAATPPVVTAGNARDYSVDELENYAEAADMPSVTPEPALGEAATPSEPTAPAPVRTLPRKGRISYVAYYGEGFAVGKTVQSWEVHEAHYRLGSVSETTGIVELFRSQRHVYLSEGRFTAKGLQPEKFFMSRTRRGRTEAARATFDWNGGMMKLGRVPDQRDATLAPESQDIVSFMYQLALAPPRRGRMRLPVTNGSRFETYDLDVLDEEHIETPLGVLRALPVKQVARPGSESIEVWLAIDYRHLPVKIRFFDRDGKPVGEQVVDDIQISDE
jgi:uncharacterized protein DUF3108